jgi:hypothetical protein
MPVAEAAQEEVAVEPQIASIRLQSEVLAMEELQEALAAALLSDLIQMLPDGK